MFQVSMGFLVKQTISFDQSGHSYYFGCFIKNDVEHQKFYIAYAGNYPFSTIRTRKVFMLGPVTNAIDDLVFRRLAKTDCKES